MNNKNSDTGYGIAFIIVVIIAIMMTIFTGGCEKESETNKWGSSIDWGPDHYWNSDTESVERIPWR